MQLFKKLKKRSFEGDLDDERVETTEATWREKEARREYDQGLKNKEIDLEIPACYQCFGCSQGATSFGNAIGLIDRTPLRAIPYRGAVIGGPD